MDHNLSQNEPVARKHHDCDACYHVLNEGIDRYGYTRPELRVLAKARKNKWKIVPGQKYIRQTNEFNGELRTFKAIPEVHKICLKYDLYDE